MGWHTCAGGKCPRELRGWHTYLCRGRNAPDSSTVPAEFGDHNVCKVVVAEEGLRGAVTAEVVVKVVPLLLFEPDRHRHIRTCIAAL